MQSQVLLLLKKIKWAYGAMRNAAVEYVELFHWHLFLRTACLCHLGHMFGVGTARFYKGCQLTAANH